MSCSSRVETVAVIGLLVLSVATPASVGGVVPEAQTYKLAESIAYCDEATATDYVRERCRLDVYYPENTSGFATVVWFHAGGLKTGSRYVPGELKKQGIAVVAAGYRLSPQVKAPVYIEDAAAAVAWVFKNIKGYGGSTERIFVAGASAGGYLVAMIGLDKKWLAIHEIDANRIAGVISVSGQAITHFTIREERGINGTQPVIDELAPLFHVRKDASPMLLVTGDPELELLGRYEENAYFWRMMKVAGHTSTELRQLQGVDHGGVEKPAHELLLGFVNKISKPASTAGERP